MGVSEARKAMLQKAAPQCADYLVLFLPKVLGQPPSKCGGMGVLVEVAGERFIVTASHVAKTFKDGSPFLPFIDSGHEGQTAVCLESCPCLGDEGPCDVAVIRLTEEIVRRLGRKKFLPLTRVDASDEVRESGAEYLVLGFPSEWREYDGSGRMMDATFLPFGTTPYIGPVEHLNEYEPSVNFAIHYPKDDVWDNFGKPASLPHPVGISGSGIWRMRAATQDVTAFSVENIRLVGIEHHLYPGPRLLTGTKMRYVLDLIYIQNEHLRKVVADAFPSISFPLP